MNPQVEVSQSPQLARLAGRTTTSAPTPPAKARPGRPAPGISGQDRRHGGRRPRAFHQGGRTRRTSDDAEREGRPAVRIHFTAWTAYQKPTSWSGRPQLAKTSTPTIEAK